MNLLVKTLDKRDISPKPLNESTLVVEDNIGESIHIHFRNIRMEMSLEDFGKFNRNLNKAKRRLETWE